jgi:hypothetical protein
LDNRQNLLIYGLRLAQFFGAPIDAVGIVMKLDRSPPKAENQAILRNDADRLRFVKYSTHLRKEHSLQHVFSS